MTIKDNGARYLIHKIGTPRLQRTTTGGIAPAGEWYVPHLGVWTTALNAGVPFVKWERDCYNLPDGGEWIEIYTEVRV
jgi:hypothetical protein